LHSLTVVRKFAWIRDFGGFDSCLNDLNLSPNFLPLDFKIFQKFKQFKHVSVLYFDIFDKNKKPEMIS
jgi:hypothetical protein